MFKYIPVCLLLIAVLVSSVFGSGCTGEEGAAIEPQPDTGPTQETEPEIEPEPVGQEETANISVESPDPENLAKEEGVIPAGPVEVEVFDYPASVKNGVTFSASWRVRGEVAGNIEESALLWGSLSLKSGNASLGAYPRKSFPQAGPGPQEFEDRIKAPLAGDIYFRAYVLVDEVEVFSREYRIPITGSTVY